MEPDRIIALLVDAADRAEAGKPVDRDDFVLAFREAARLISIEFGG